MFEFNILTQAKKAATNQPTPRTHICLVRIKKEANKHLNKYKKSEWNKRRPYKIPEKLQQQQKYNNNNNEKLC